MHYCNQITRKIVYRLNFPTMPPKLSLQPYSPSNVYEPVARVNMSKWKKRS